MKKNKEAWVIGNYIDQETILGTLLPYELINLIALYLASDHRFAYLLNHPPRHQPGKQKWTVELWNSEEDCFMESIDVQTKETFGLQDHETIYHMQLCHIEAEHLLSSVAVGRIGLLCYGRRCDIHLLTFDPTQPIGKKVFKELVVLPSLQLNVDPPPGGWRFPYGTILEDGRAILCSDYEQTLIIWDLSKEVPERLSWFRHAYAFSTALLYNPTRLLIPSRDATTVTKNVRIIDLSTYEVRNILEPWGREVLSLPDGSIFSFSDRQSCHIFRATDLKKSFKVQKSLIRKDVDLLLHNAPGPNVFVLDNGWFVIPEKTGDPRKTRFSVYESTLDADPTWSIDFYLPSCRGFVELTDNRLMTIGNPSAIIDFISKKVVIRTLKFPTYDRVTNSSFVDDLLELASATTNQGQTIWIESCFSFNTPRSNRFRLIDAINERLGTYSK